MNRGAGDRTGPDRRAVLRVAGLATVAGAAAVLAACSSDTSAGAASQSSAAATASGSEPSSTASSTSPSPRANSGASSKPSGPSVTTSQVPVGGGVVMDNADYVVTQPSGGTFKAFSKICTHGGCPVARVANGQILCDCHNSAFSITDGSVIAGPAQQPLPEYKVDVSGGKAYVQS